MSKRKRVPKKLCPQCGWDVEGKPREGAASIPSAGAEGVRRRAPAPVQHDFSCDNCGFAWTE